MKAVVVSYLNFHVCSKVLQYLSNTVVHGANYIDSRPEDSLVPVR